MRTKFHPILMTNAWTHAFTQILPYLTQNGMKLGMHTK